VAGGPSQKENPRCIYAAPAQLATRDTRPRQLPTDTSHAAPTRECQSDPPSLPRDARHPTLAPLSTNPRRPPLTFCSMSDACAAIDAGRPLVTRCRSTLMRECRHW
jgi:hypothetical protein